MYVNAHFSFSECVIAAMIDSIGEPQRVNNCLTTLDLPSISHKNLKCMERRAGNLIEAYAYISMASATEASFDAEMRLALNIVWYNPIVCFSGE